MMKHFLLALQFLTVLPVKLKVSITRKDLGKSLLYFPVIGLLIGLILAATAILTGFLPQAVVVSLVIAVSIIITGGIHLDGFADTCDAFYGNRQKARILEIMRDSRIGVMGVAGIVSLLLIKFSVMANMAQYALFSVLIMMAVYGRWAQVMACYIADYAREEGKAEYFVKYARPREFIAATLITAGVFLLLAGLKGIFLFIFALLPVFLFINHSKRKIGGVTGDTIGATSEIAEVTILLLSLIM